MQPDLEFFDSVDTVVHESTHVFQNIMEYVGEDSPGNETEAYAIGLISSTLLKDVMLQATKEITDAIHEGRETGLP